MPGPTVDAVRRRGAGRRHGRRARRQRARPRLALQHAAGLRRRRQPRAQAPQDHADLSRADDLGAGRRRRASRSVDTAVGRVGALACWEHYNPLARYALMAQHEEIHAAQFPGSLVGPIFADQIEVTIRHHALESGCFVVNATGWLTEEQIAPISPDDRARRRRLRGGCITAIVSPEGKHLGAAADGRRGHGDRRPRHVADHQAQADDGLASATTPARAAAAAGPSHARAARARAMPRPSRWPSPRPSVDAADDADAALLRPSCRRRGAAPLEVDPTRWRRGRPPRRRRPARTTGRCRCGGTTVMVPVHTAAAGARPIGCESRRDGGRRRQRARSRAATMPLGRGGASRSTPRFYALHDRRRRARTRRSRTLHGARRAGHHGAADLHPLREPHEDLPVLRDRPVAGGRPHHRAQDAGAARRGRARRRCALDGVKHMVLTTGTPATRPTAAPPSWPRERACAIKAAVDLPIQVQCEPPDDDRLVRAHEGGRHRHARHAPGGGRRRRCAPRIMPGKASVPVALLPERLRGGGRGLRPRPGQHLHPRRARRHARGASSAMAETLLALGVYPFVVPFVPIAGTPLARPAGAAGGVHGVDPRAAGSRRWSARRA